MPKALTLPRLPVPDLDQTLERYLTSLEPFMLEDESHGGMSYASAYTLRTKWIDQFKSGLGRVLQERLISLEKVSPNNWLDDNFWMNTAYLEWRAPLLVNSNWWLAFKDDETIPQPELIEDVRTGGLSGITPWQVRRAAWLVYRILDLQQKMRSNELHPDTTRIGLWMQDCVFKMFNRARIPKPLCDVVTDLPSFGKDKLPPSYRAITVVIHNWYYAVLVCDENNTLLPLDKIEAGIWYAVYDAHVLLQKGERAPEVGILSADGRDIWHHNMTHLLSQSVDNKMTMQFIVDSIMCLCLDTLPPAIKTAPTSPTQFTSAPRKSSLDEHLHSVRSTVHNVANRWFDKTFSLIVDPLARAGATGEHSPVDALVPSIVTEYALIEPCPPRNDDLDHNLSDPGIRLNWVVDDAFRSDRIIPAAARACAVIENSDDSVMWFEEYGTDWIKNDAKFSPDAYIQMALQLAYYRRTGEFTATYETALTRMFRHGRTETIRTFTRESREWVLAMCAEDPERVRIPKDQRVLTDLLRVAVRKHTDLTRQAIVGQGIDRHLLGLKFMLRPEIGESVALFEDQLFARSQQWKLSTSGLSAGYLFKGTGFGASYEDGYGINYLAAPDMIKFGIESKFSCPTTSTELLKLAITDALREMRDTIISSQTLNEPRSRL
ncbi:acyltransferase ChoActase/COT/CPT [Fistulina hepatica ATCC 64428]|nr:acyltransferase ChoActase/COT/CPT [Fistulina hepatica ATCC 64428]